MFPITIIPYIKCVFVGIIVLGAASIYHKAVVTKMEHDYTDLRVKHEKLVGITQIQNEEIEKLHTMGKQYGDLLNLAVEKNAKNQKMWQDVVRGIQTEVVPTDCEGAFNHLKGKLKQHASGK